MTIYFPSVENQVAYEGAQSKNPLAYKYYDADRVVGGKTMKEILRFSVCYWHTFKGTGIDPFGWGEYHRPWDRSQDPMQRAFHTLEAAFELFQKLGVPYYCFHDRDIAPEGATFKESCDNLEKVVARAKEMQTATGVKLLWGTANLFSNPRYTHGGASNPDAHIHAYGAAQVKHALDATYELGGENYVFWGGREGYDTWLNTNMKHEREQIARFFHMVIDYAKRIGFTGQFLIEPKPKEPTKHQYDFDSATVLDFLREFDLIDHFKLNIEANHATLAGHTFEHELTVCSDAGKLGSIDANRGDYLLGWDTDQFPNDLAEITRAMLVVLKQGGLGSGGLNFDAKVRRGSVDTEDILHAHIGGMDIFAHALLIAQQILDDGEWDAILKKRYASYQTGVGQEIMNGTATLESLEAWVLQQEEPVVTSGQQELIENLFNSYH